MNAAEAENNQSKKQIDQALSTIKLYLNDSERRELETKFEVITTTEKNATVRFERNSNR